MKGIQTRHSNWNIKLDGKACLNNLIFNLLLNRYLFSLFLQQSFHLRFQNISWRKSMPVMAIFTTIGADPKPTILFFLHCFQKVFTNLYTSESKQMRCLEAHQWFEDPYANKHVESWKLEHRLETIRRKKLTISVGLFILYSFLFDSTTFSKVS